MNEVLSKIIPTNPNIKHGHAVRGKPQTSEYKCWASMKQRCNNPNSQVYEYYGARGITYCSRWEYFENFLDDMGLKPSPKHSIERIDNNGNYEPGNCKWETQPEQLKNRRKRKIDYNGLKITIDDLEDMLQVSRGSIRFRLKKQYPLERAIRLALKKNHIEILTNPPLSTLSARTEW